MKAGTPESVGISSARLARLDAAFAKRIRDRELAGVATLVARRGRLVHFHTQGMADVAAGRPLAEDTIYLIYSMTKPVTAVGLLTLFEEGMFQLDDPVSAIIPELARFRVLTSMTAAGPELEDLQRPVTFRHLFTHTSGIPYAGETGTPVEKLLWEALGMSNMKEPISLTLADCIPLLAKGPLAHQPGAGYTYGFSIDVLGRLIEVMSGRTLDVFLDERIFRPLGMRDTFFAVPEEKKSRVAVVYGKGADGTLQRNDSVSAGYGLAPRFLSGGGGLYSTASDYLHFAQMLTAGGELDGVRILGRHTVDLMRSCHVPQIMDLPAVRDGSAFGPGCTYGLGGRVVVDDSKGLFGSIGTYGWDGAAGTTFLSDPREELTALFFTHVSPWPPGIHEQFKTLVYQALV
jgi:CubicO group peptidase (beta-lactamase class C family)